MDRSDIVKYASELLEFYRSSLLIDPYFQINIELLESDTIFSLKKNTASLSWTIQINPIRHDEVEDIEHTIIESLLYILFEDLNYIKENASLIKEVKDRVVSRLATAILKMNTVEEESEEESLDE